MAGSRVTVGYVGDNGTTYSISVDESNVELIMGAQVLPNGSAPALPKGTKARFVRLESELGLVKRVVPVLTLARFTSLTGATPFVIAIGDIDVGTPVRVRNKTGEKNRFIPRDYDTGKLDGDIN